MVPLLNTHLLELQRMFEHSNIIRLRFSRTNFFHERTFVDARWSIFGSKSAELRRSRASAGPRCSCGACPGSRRSGNRPFNLNKEWKTILLKFRTPFRWRESETISRFCAGHCVLWPQLEQAATGDTRRSKLLGGLISGSPMSRDDLHTKRWSPSRVDLPVLPRESPSGKIQTRYFPPRREISETNNSCSCSCSNSCSNLSHSWCMGEQLSYIHCWGVPQGSRSRPPASTGTLRYTPPVNVGNCTSSTSYMDRTTCSTICTPSLLLVMIIFS